MRKPLVACNYHADKEEFSVGDDVVHIGDDRSEHAGKIKGYKLGMLYLHFSDGTEGWAGAHTCYKV